MLASSEPEVAVRFALTLQERLGARDWPAEVALDGGRAKKE